MKHHLTLQETAQLVFLLEKTINLITITISDKPIFHLILLNHSRSSDDNPQLRTMQVVGKGRASRIFFDRHFESYHWTSIQTNMLVITGPASRQTCCQNKYMKPYTLNIQKQKNFHQYCISQVLNRYKIIKIKTTKYLSLNKECIIH